MSNEASSTSTLPSAQSSQSTDPKAEYPDAISLTVPSSFLILPPMAVSLGLVIGMYRGGRMARLRFLAENAHRQPRTLQGWYFYTKTRNYKIAYASALQGGKTAIALGGATTTYVFLEEYISYLRESVLGIYAPRGGSGAGFRDAVTWRSGGCVWWDGVLAGTILGGAVGLIWRLPGRLVGRCLGFGAIMGGIHSYTRVISAKLAEKIKIDQAEEIASLPAKETPTPPTPSTQPEKVVEIVPAEQIQTSKMEHPFVDKEVEPAPRPPSAFSDIDGLLAGEERKSQSWWDSAKSWVGRS